jgi:Fe-S cluster assembly protein SufD
MSTVMTSSLLSKLSSVQVADLSRATGESDWMREKRLRAFEMYAKSPREAFRYGIGILSNAHLVGGMGVDAIGGSSFEMSDGDMKMPSGVRMVRFADAWHDTELVALLMQYVVDGVDGIERSPLLALHHALFRAGVVIVLDADRVHEEFITIPAGADHVVVVAQERSKARIRIIHEDAAAVSSSFMVQCIVKDGASLDVMSFHNPGLEHRSFVAKHAVVGKDAKVRWVDALLGDAVLRTWNSTHLRGEGAQALTRKLFFGKERQNYDLYDEVVHHASHTSSDMRVRGVLTDRAKAVVRGLIRIEKHAVACDGEQREDTLLLSDSCEVDPIPSLEILNNDVRCAHGSSTGQVDEDTLFYLMSRGIDRETAVREVVQGFLGEIVSEIGDADMQARVAREIGAQLMKSL